MPPEQRRRFDRKGEGPGHFMPAGAGGSAAESSPKVRHRLTHSAFLLALTAVVLFVSGVVTLISLNSTGARQDRAAQTSLLVTLAAAQGRPSETSASVELLGSRQASSVGTQVSEASADGQWFGAARSGSGRCFVLAGLVITPAVGPFGSLADEEPCTGEEARERLDRQLAPG